MIGRTISHYRIVEKIGEGGMGEVYLAEDTSLQRKVALKFLPTALADDELAHKRFLREPAPLARFMREIPELLEHTVDKMLAKGPGDRYQSVHEVQTNLKEVAAESKLVLQKVPRWLLWTTAAGVLVTLAVVIAAALWWWSSSELHRSPAAPLKITPFTTEEGLKESPHFSPDGERVAYEWDGPARDNIDIYVKALGAGSVPIRLTNDPAEDRAPAWSPDGRKIAFTGVFDDGASAAIYLVPSLGGPERKLTDRRTEPRVLSHEELWSVSWSQDGKNLIFSDRESSEAPSRIVQMSIESLEKKVLTQPPYESRGDSGPEFSPDGSQIVFESNRSGQDTVWKCNSDGTSPAQLTNFEEWSGTARWSPDGRMIAFDSLHSGNWDLWLTDPEGGVPQQLTMDSSDENNPTWSRDGRWLYFSSTRTGKREIFKIPSQGGEATQLTGNGGFYARESTDGQYVFYTKLTELGLWRVPSNGDGEEEEVLPDIFARDFATGKRGIYFARRASQDFRIYLLGSGTGETTELYARKGPFHQFTDLAVSPDEKWLLFSERPMATSELMLVENFY